jgi:hypothetical protein
MKSHALTDSRLISVHFTCVFPSQIILHRIFLFDLLASLHFEPVHKHLFLENAVNNWIALAGVGRSPLNKQY